MFLLDTSVLSDLMNPSRPLHAKAVAFKNQHAGDEQHLFICVISLAEMQFGLDLYEGHASRPSQADLDSVRRHIKAACSISEPLEVTRHVALEQGRLRAKWAKKLAPIKATQGKLKGSPPERWSND